MYIFYNQIYTPKLKCLLTVSCLNRSRLFRVSPGAVMSVFGAQKLVVCGMNSCSPPPVCVTVETHLNTGLIHICHSCFPLRSAKTKQYKYRRAEGMSDMVH